MDLFDIEFYEYSMIADDPKKLEQLQNHYYDPEFEEWMEEFEQEQEEKQKSSQDDKFGGSKQLDLPDKETIKWSEKNHNKQEILTEEYEEVSDQSSEISDWEEVDE